MSTGLKANSDGSAAIQVGGTDVITLTSGGAATFVTSPTTVQAGTAAAPSITFSGDTNTGIYSPGADTVAIATGGTKRFEVDAAGNAGLGVTPSAWSTANSIRAFQIGPSGVGSFWNYNNYAAFVGCGYYWNGTNRIYLTTGNPVSEYSQNSGVHQWLTAPSGTAGNNITFTAVMSVEGGKSLALEGATSQTGTGITFPATQSASSNANTLDDYEEGTWTPSLGGTATYTNQVGKYTKIGNMVSIYCMLRVNTIGTGSTTNISGLPFTSAQRGGGGMTYWASLSQAVDFLYPNAEGTNVNFLGGTAATANPTDGIAIFQNSAYVIFSATYFV